MSGFSVRALDRGLHILTCFGNPTQNLTLTEVKEQTGLSVSTVSRLLATLVAQGFLSKDADKKYALGDQIFKLAEKHDSRIDLRQLAYPFLENMRNMFDETASLYVAQKGMRVCVESIQSHQALRRTVEAGEILPITQGAVGYALLAWQPYIKRCKIIASHRGISEEELSTIRQEGYVINDGVHEPGVLAIAAPILNDRGECVAGIAMSGPSTRLGRASTPELIKVIKANAQAISQRLGYKAYVDDAVTAPLPII